MKKLSFWILLVVFVGLSVWWVFYFPYNPTRLYRAIPSYATVISEHRRLGKRWNQVTGNPFTRAVVSGMGEYGEAVSQVLDDPGVAAAIRSLSGEHLVIGYVPILGRNGDPALVFASWLGSRAQLLRFGVLSHLSHDLKKVRLGVGGTAWVLDCGGGMVLSLTVSEGMLLACLSSDPHGVQYVVNRVATDSPLVPELREQLEASGSRRFPDQGWIRWYVGHGDSLGLHRIRYGLNLSGSDGISGWLSGEQVGAQPGAGIDSADMTLKEMEDASAEEAIHEVGAILRDAPVAVLLTPLDLIENVMERDDISRKLKSVWRGLSGKELQPGGHGFAALLGGDDYSGHILSLRVPVLLMGFRLREDYAEDTVNRLLDTVNAAFGCALIGRRLSSGTESAGIRRSSGDGQVPEVVIIETTESKGLYAGLRHEDRPAVATCGGWLVFSSNAAILQRLVRQWPYGDVAKLSWAESLARIKAPGRVWVDMERAGQDVRNALAVYSLSLMLGDRRSSQSIRDRVDAIREWINWLQPLSHAAAGFDLERSAYTATFQFGSGDYLVDER